MTKVRFDVEEYRRRLKLFRELVSGENQADFARTLGIPFKRWNNYERGYPVPRETAFLILEKFHGMSVEWIWFGYTGNLSTEFAEKIRIAEQYDKQAEATRKEYERVTKKMNIEAEKRRKALQIKPNQPASSSSR